MKPFNTAYKSFGFHERRVIKAEIIEALRIRKRTWEAYVYGKSNLSDEKIEKIRQVFRKHGVSEPFDAE